MIRFLLIIIGVFIGAGLVGCGHVGGLNVQPYSMKAESAADFLFCHGYGWSQQMRIGLHTAEWNMVLQLFDPVAKTAEQERTQIASAVAMMEQYSAAITGTGNDQPKAPIIRQSDKELDCIDETINTTKYLTFLDQAGALYWHEVASPVYKGYLIDGTYPHNSAAIKEKESAQIYVVDSYIYAGGQEPDIRPLEDWLVRRVEAE